MRRGLNITSEAIAISAIKYIRKYLTIAVKNGQNLEARNHVVYASTMGELYVANHCDVTDGDIGVIFKKSFR